jgi:hypothetical protein
VLPTSRRDKWDDQADQPIMPLTDTLAAVTRVAQTIISSLSRVALMPIVRASSSPSVSTLIRQRTSKSGTRPIAMV